MHSFKCVCIWFAHTCAGTRQHQKQPCPCAHKGGDTAAQAHHPLPPTTTHTCDHLPRQPPLHLRCPHPCSFALPPQSRPCPLAPLVPYYPSHLVQIPRNVRSHPHQRVQTQPHLCPGERTSAYLRIQGACGCAQQNPRNARGSDSLRRRHPNPRGLWRAERRPPGVSCARGARQHHGHHRHAKRW